MALRAGFCAAWLLAVSTAVADGRAGAAMAGTAADAAETYAFDVYLDDRRIGSHEWRISEPVPGERHVVSEADFEVRFLFVTAFAYAHRNAEHWQQDCLASLTAETDRNGDQRRVAGERTGEAFVVVAGNEERVLPACVMSFAYWNPGFLDERRLLDPETGQYVDVDIERADTGGADGRTAWIIRARGLEITVWYDAARRWVGLEAPARGGRTLRYVPS